MYYSKNSISGFADQTTTHIWFSVFPIISDDDIKLMKIKKLNNNNRRVFLKSVKLFVRILKKNTKKNEEKQILIWESSRYHLVEKKKVIEKLKKKDETNYDIFTKIFKFKFS